MVSRPRQMPDRCAIIGTGPSMSYELAQRIRMTFSRRVVVSNAYELDHDAEALVSTDVNWWNVYRPSFEGKRWCGKQGVATPLAQSFGDRSDINSGCLAIQIAREVMQCRTIYLFGFDMHDRKGAHYFGSHISGCKNTSRDRWPIFHKQFEDEAVMCYADGVKVYNATPETDLKIFPIIYPNEVLDTL